MPIYPPLQVGSVVAGVVKCFKPVGIFVELKDGIIDGLLRTDQISYGRIETAERIFKIGDCIKVMSDFLSRGMGLFLVWMRMSSWSRDLRPMGPQFRHTGSRLGHIITLL